MGSEAVVSVSEWTAQQAEEPVLTWLGFGPTTFAHPLTPTRNPKMTEERITVCNLSSSIQHSKQVNAAQGNADDKPTPMLKYVLRYA